MYQTVGHEAIDAIARAMELPLVRRAIQGSSVHTELTYDTASQQATTTGGQQQDDEVEDLFSLLTSVKVGLSTFFV